MLQDYDFDDDYDLDDDDNDASYNYDQGHREDHPPKYETVFGRDDKRLI